MTNDLSNKSCQPPKKGSLPLSGNKLNDHLTKVPGWHLTPDHLMIEREFQFADFVSALQFTNRVGELAETENHHPNLCLHDWNKVTITTTTHSIGGLSQNDFILAAKINELVDQIQNS